jgi:plastocyanin
VTVGFQSKDYTIQAMVFLPGDLWIDAGDTVVWTPGTGEEHLVTFLQAGHKPSQIDPTDMSHPGFGG